MFFQCLIIYFCFKQISANEAPGAFYGVQSLISLSSARSSKKSGQIPDCEISDTPRYPYRGMHVDISRNFQSKDEILLLLDVMAMYKLNQFHFHLTDDEGWRLEIPGLKELTEVCDQIKNCLIFLYFNFWFLKSFFYIYCKKQLFCFMLRGCYIKYFP